MASSETRETIRFPNGRIDREFFRDEKGLLHELVFWDNEANVLAAENVLKDRLTVSESRYDRRGAPVLTAVVGYMETPWNPYIKGVRVYSIKLYKEGGKLEYEGTAQDSQGLLKTGRWTFFGEQGEPVSFEDYNLDGDLVTKGSLLSFTQKVKRFLGY